MLLVKTFELVSHGMFIKMISSLLPDVISTQVVIIVRVGSDGRVVQMSQRFITNTVKLGTSLYNFCESSLISFASEACLMRYDKAFNI